MRKQRNYVAEAYAKTGGLVQATAAMRVSQTTARDYEKRGRVLLAEAAIRLSRASGIPIEKLAGVEG